MKSVLEEMSQEMYNMKTNKTAAPAQEDNHHHQEDQRHHRQQQQQSFKYQCKQCEWSSRYSYNVARHNRKAHWGQLEFPCDLCPAVLGWSRATLRNHKARFHREREVLCDQCDYRGHNQEIVHSHQVAVHEMRYRRKLECRQCGQYYVNQWGLDRHILRVHAGVKEPKKQPTAGVGSSWPCGLCPRVFGQKRYLNRHMINYHHAH